MEGAPSGPAGHDDDDDDTTLRDVTRRDATQPGVPRFQSIFRGCAVRPSAERSAPINKYGQGETLRRGSIPRIHEYTPRARREMPTVFHGAPDRRISESI